MNGATIAPFILKFENNSKMQVSLLYLLLFCVCLPGSQFWSTRCTVFSRGPRNKILAGANAVVLHNGSGLGVTLVPLSYCLQRQPAKRLCLSSQTASTPHRGCALVAVQATVDQEQHAVIPIGPSEVNASRAYAVLSANTSFGAAVRSHSKSLVKVRNGAAAVCQRRLPCTAVAVACEASSFDSSWCNLFGPSRTLRTLASSTKRRTTGICGS